MLVYSILIFLFLFASFFYKSKRIGNFIFLFLFFLCFFRGIKVGIDTEAYYLNDMADGSINGINLTSYSYELLFLFFRQFVIDNHLPSRFVLFGLAIVTYLFYYKSCRTFKTNIVLFCLFFYLFNFFFHSMNIARQLAASSIILYAYSFLDKKNHYLFFPLVLLASSIHLSSIICLVFYFIRFMPHFSLGKSPLLVYFVFTFLFFFSPLLADSIIGFIQGDMGVLLDSYSRFVDEAETNSRSLLVYFIDFINLIISVRVLIWLKGDEKYKVIANLFLVSLVLGTLAGSLSGNILRILIGINSIRIIGYALYFSDMKLNVTNGKILLFAVFVLLNMYLINHAIFKGNYGVYPYYMTLSFQ